MAEFRDSIVNRLLLLYMIAQTIKQGYIKGKVKLMKMVYLSQEKMVKDRLRGFNYTFYKWKYGPMSDRVLEDFESLVAAGLITSPPGSVGLTNEACKILKTCRELFDRNRKILAAIDKTANEYAPYNGKQIKLVVYGRPIPGEKKRVELGEVGEVLLTGISEKEAVCNFLIDEEWLETLDILLDKEARESLQRGIEDARQGRVSKYIPMNQTKTSA
jgi:uncharacterized protein YwgA